LAGVVYTRHAEEKFEVIKRHGFEVIRKQVEETLAAPDMVIPQAKGRMIAQRHIIKRHVSRLIYRQEGEDLVVITFYPGRRERYEVKL
jgi:mRNA-degrading endonuclease RelE of RelBE toxin-antitoxin system